MDNTLIGENAPHRDTFDLPETMHGLGPVQLDRADLPMEMKHFGFKLFDLSPLGADEFWGACNVVPPPLL